MVVNKGPVAITATTTLRGFAPAPTAARFSYSGANPGTVVRHAALPVSATGWTATYQASSITLLVLTPA